jgi:hypothetical protein
VKDIDAIKGQYRATSCEWTLSDEKEGHFFPTCGKDVVPEKAYCADHMKEAYHTPKRKKRGRK